MSEWNAERRTDRVQIKISPSLKDAAKTRADEDGRTLSNYIENLIKADIEAHAPVKKAYDIYSEWAKEMRGRGNVVRHLRLPNVGVGTVCRLGDVWDGNGEVPENDYSYELNANEDFIEYEWETIEDNENPLERLIKITKVWIG